MTRSKDLLMTEYGLSFALSLQRYAIESGATCYAPAWNLPWDLPAHPSITVTDPNGMNECFSENFFNVPLFSILTGAIMDSVDFHTRWPLPSEFAQFHGGNPLQYNNAIPQ